MFKKSLSCVLIFSQLAFASAGSADSDPAPGVTPEINLLSSVIALEGQKISAPELAQQIQSRFEQYNAQAPRDGRLDRIEQALVEMGIYTPAQTHLFESQVRSVSKTLSSSFASTEQADEALENQLTSIALQADGAQFSSCGVYETMFTAGLAVFFGALIGVVAANSQDVFDQGNLPTQDGWLGGVGLAGVILAAAGAVLYSDHYCSD